MRKAVLIINSAAGRAAELPARRDALLRLCKEAAWDARLVETTPEAGSASRLARDAVQAGAALVLACGGDGTVHGALQGLAGTETALGVLPFGTANALARNLALPLEPLAALRALLAGSARRIPLGSAENTAEARYFAVLAGAGPDGALVEDGALMQAAVARAGAKARWGRSAYYGRSLRLLLTRRFSAFRVEYRPVGSSEWMQTVAAGVLTGRVPDLGGLFRQVCAGSRMDHGFLELQIIHAPAQLSFAAWIGLSHLRLGGWNPWLRTVRAEEVRCLPLAAEHRVAAQVDGEAFGHLPLTLRLVPDALWLQMPQSCGSA